MTHKSLSNKRTGNAEVMWLSSQLASYHFSSVIQFAKAHFCALAQFEKIVFTFSIWELKTLDCPGINI